MGISMKKEQWQLLIRRFFLSVCDVIAVIIAEYGSLLVRFDLELQNVDQKYLEVANHTILLIAIFTILIFAVFRLYNSLWTYAGGTEMALLTMACLVASVVNALTVLLTYRERPYPMPRSCYVLFFVILLLVTFVVRYSYRFFRHIKRSFQQTNSACRVLLIGAGDAGNALIKEMHNSEHVEKKVVAVIDNDPRKKGGYIHGVRIVGDRSRIRSTVDRLGINEIIIALPSAKESEVKEILDICKETGCKLLRLPGIYQLVNDEVSVSKLKEVDVNDLLGRDPVKVDLDEIMDYVTDRTILVTGGGGSIGSELCRQIASYNPKQLVMIDIYENSLYDIQQELRRDYPDLNLVALVASVRNTRRMDQIFEEYRPEIVYHAAAHKHVPLMEDSPNEAVKNNVLGTWKVAEAADHWGVKRFVMISTDKAVNPTNIMGATKRICEMIVQAYNDRSQTEFVAVRFGNVLGSNGSVIPLFKKQITEGGPVTVTHPDIIRYFMTIPEAVSLVLQAGAYAKGGEIFVLDMGEPVKIADLARNLILLSGHKPDEDIMITYTGLRPGEKLYEEMLMDEEGLRETENKLIHIGQPIKFDEEAFFDQLAQLKEYVVTEPGDIRGKVKSIVPTYHPKLC